MKAVAEYALAADSFAQCARLYPTDPRAKAALSDAVLLRLGLGEDAEAMKLASDFVRLYGASDRTMSATIMFAMAKHHEEQEEWDAAREILVKNQRLIESAPVDVRIQAHLTLARALLHGRTPDLAYPELAAARQLFGDGSTLDSQLAQSYPSDSENQLLRRSAKVRTANGDALVLLADRERERRLAPLRPPIYTGPRSVDALHRHLTTAASEWMQKRRAAIEEVERLYVAVLELQPVPPPKGVIAAAGAVGKMWADYADDLARLVPLDAYPRTRAAGAPTTTPTRAEAAAMVAEVRAPILERLAIPAMRKCVDLSVKYLYTDDRSAACEQWLVKNDPATHERSDLAPSPRRYRPVWIREEPRRSSTSTSTSTSR